MQTKNMICEIYLEMHDFAFFVLFNVRKYKNNNKIYV